MNTCLAVQRILKPRDMKYMNRDDVNLTLFFTKGVGLKTWAEIGSLDREVAIYKRLTEHLNSVSFVTYGGHSDLQYGRSLAKIQVAPLIWHRLTHVTILNLLFRHWHVIRNATIFKTNQIQGAEIPIWLKKIFKKKLIVRCGWLWSLNLEKQTDDARAIKRARLMEKNAFESADLVVVTTPYIRQQIIDKYNISPDSVSIIPNYVDTDSFLPDLTKNKSDSSVWKICFVGRHSPEKNIVSLLRAIHLCRDKVSKPIHLDLYGSGPQTSDMKHIIDDLRLDVSFYGNIPNSQLPSKLTNADIFILPSFYEGHPKSLLEAMSCGLPCIGTDVRGIKELICHKVTGYLCNTDDKSIAGAIKEVFSDENLRTAMGRNARKYMVENFSLEKVLKMELDVIQKVINM